jgi:hypothetical protein
MKIDKADRQEILENALAYVVVFAMLVYGFGKYVQFGDLSKNHIPVSQLTGMQLMWAFYGYSKPFVLVIGFLEVSGGILIFFRKTRLLGCLLTSTVLVNVILQDIFYGVLVGALKAAIIYQTLILIILWWNRANVIAAFKTLLRSFPKRENYKEIFIKLLISLVLFVIFRIVEYYLTMASW